MSCDRVLACFKLPCLSSQGFCVPVHSLMRILQIRTVRFSFHTISICATVCQLGTYRQVSLRKQRSTSHQLGIAVSSAQLVRLKALHQANDSLWLDSNTSLQYWNLELQVLHLNFGSIFLSTNKSQARSAAATSGASRVYQLMQRY